MTDLLVLPVRGDAPDAWRQAAGDAFDTALGDAERTGAPAVLIPADGDARRIAVVSVGDEGDEAWRTAAAGAARLARALEAETVVLASPDADAAGPLAEGFALGLYRYDRYRTALPPPEVTFTVRVEGGGGDDAVAAARVRAAAVGAARDMVNRAPDEKMPAELAGLMADGARAAGLEVEVWAKARIEEEGMGGLLGVNRGSLDPPRFLILRHAPVGARAAGPVVLVGKGVTYDTGGLSLKPTKNSMDKMKADMGGAAAVYGAMLALAGLDVEHEVVALIPMSDNRPGGRAYAPGDVLTMHSGATVEVMNTDAEGRLLLADALSYARSLGPRLAVDVATLTGAQGVALGDRVAAAVVRPGAEALADAVRRAGERSGDLAWPLPLYPHYRTQLESPVADLKNVGGPMAGTITAAAFLEHFTRHDGEPDGDGRRAPNGGEAAYPWLHLDIARPSFIDAVRGVHPVGATGFGVRLLVDLLSDLPSALGDAAAS